MNIGIACISVICNYITKSPKHRRDNWSKVMNTQISSKFAALAVALMMNSLIIGAVAYLFNAPPHPTVAVAEIKASLPTHLGA
jgi:hypothetical protein